MLGKSVGRPMRLAALAVSVAALAFAIAACAHNVAQDSKSGGDAKPKGAKELTLENGEAKDKGIVTYPGGDRVDWKMIELPKDSKGALDIKLQWTPPRPGLQLAFDVFDEWNTPVLSSKRGSRRRSKGRTKIASLDNAKGKYFIRVYAVGRGDAGAYKLTLDFNEKTAGPLFDPLKLDIPEPPRLAAVPDPEVPCDPTQFDQKNPACKNVCPDFGAPPGWPPCKDKCPATPDVNIPACQLTMPCPNPPDRRVRACKKSQWPKCNLQAPDPQNPNCDDAKADPVVARILKQETQGGDLVVTIGAGTGAGVKKDWKATVLRGDTDSPLSGGDVQIVRVDAKATIGKVHLTADQVKQNDRVKLAPP
ncbi:MAG TPA: hypothetical protein VGM39_21240 [Kofleriaceae bacterium]|jgi:hypothetical protein